MENGGHEITVVSFLYAITKTIHGDVYPYA